MNRARAKEIEQLRNRLANLKAEQEREQQESETLERAQQELLATLEAAGIGFDAYVRAFSKDIRKILNKLERTPAKSKAAPSATGTGGTKSTARKKRRRVKAKSTIKIPAGEYANIPDAPDRIFQVKEKGPRPKLLKAHAQALGLEAFLAQCRVSDEAKA